MNAVPQAITLEQLLRIETEQVAKSVWILDSADASFEISSDLFLDTLQNNLSRGIEYRWIFPKNAAATTYWSHLESKLHAARLPAPALDRLQARFLPAEAMRATSDFVIYDAKTMQRCAYIGLYQDGEYWHFKADHERLASLIAGFEFLWTLPAELESMLAVHAAGKDDLAYQLPHGLLPDDLTRSINENYAEILKVYRAGCTTAAISLCGRLIETLLHAIYEKLEGTPPEPDWGMDALGSRLKKYGLFLPALKEQFSLIKKFRNKAVHGGVEFPTPQQAEAIVLLTRDLMTQVVGQTARHGSVSESH